MRPVSEVFTSSTFREGKGGAGIVIRAGGGAVRVIRRAVRAESRAHAAYRALLYGLSRAHSTGVRQIRVFSDYAEIVAQIAGSADVPPELTGLY
ncbi:MAG: reverse transcriptase-like protein, partial [bacterium]